MNKSTKLLSLMLSVSMASQIISSVNIDATKDSITFYDVKNNILDLKAYDAELDTNHDGNMNVFDVIRANKTLIQEESYTDLKEKVYLLETQIESLYQKLNEKSDKEEGKQLSSNDYTDEEKQKLEGLKNYDDAQIKSEVSELSGTLTGKVDKEEGKQLSSNDYTDEEKQKLESLSNYDDTQIKSEVSELSGTLTGKVDKEEGKQLSSNDYTDEEKQKLEGLNNYDDTKINEKIDLLVQTAYKEKMEIESSIENKVDKEKGKQLSSNDFTDEEKQKLYILNNYDDSEIKESINDLENKIEYNPLEGKKISIMGDSISTFSGYNPEGYEIYYPDGDVTNYKDTYWGMLISEENMQLEVNNSYAGSCVGTQWMTGSTKVPATSEERLSNLGNPDVIIVQSGTNDYGGNPLGEYDFSNYSDKTQFKVSYAYLLNELKKRYPSSRIICCTFTARSDRSIPNVFPIKQDSIKNSLATDKRTSYMYEFNDAVVELAKIYNCYVCDFSDLVNYYDLENETVDGVIHPNKTTHRLMKERLKSALLSAVS